MHFIFMKKTSILKERIERTMGKEIMVAIKNKRSNASMAIAKAIIDEYQPSNAEEIQDALKDISGPMFEAMLQGEIDAHLGYTPDGHGAK